MYPTFHVEQRVVEKLKKEIEALEKTLHAMTRSSLPQDMNLTLQLATRVREVDITSQDIELLLEFRKDALKHYQNRMELEEHHRKFYDAIGGFR